MLPVLTAEQSRAVEERAVSEDGVSLGALMRAAGAAVAQELSARVPTGDVVVLAGPGNNGGDGWVAARDLLAEGRRVRVLALRDPSELSGPAAAAAAEAIAAGVPWSVPVSPPTAGELSGAAAVVDALLGTGSVGVLRDPLPGWVAAANFSGAFILAVDQPTGVSTDTGEVPDHAIEADCTVTFSAPTRGIVMYPGAGCAGEVVVADIGIDARHLSTLGVPEVWDAEEFAALLPLPALDAHKNDRGRVLVIAGSGRYPGAAVLAARGAMRMGAGYVTLAVPEPVVAVAQAHLLSAPVVGLPSSRGRTFTAAAAEHALDLAADYDAVVLGPGLTLADGAVATVRRLAARLDKPLVIDADALNALVDAAELACDRSAPTVLTPHPGELARLLGVSAAAVQADRVSSSAKLARERCAVVLKGAGTIVSGAGRQLFITAGTPALATAGTGDVLAGMTGALLAQGLHSFEAAALAAHVHARAGEAAASALTPICVNSEDVPEYIPAAVAELLEAW